MNIGNKPRVKVMAYISPTEVYRRQSHLVVGIYNNNFDSSFVIERLDKGKPLSIHNMKTERFSNFDGGTRQRVIARKKHPAFNAPVVGGYFIHNDFTRRILSTGSYNHRVPLVDKIAFAVFLFEKVNYYGNIQKVLDKDEEIRQHIIKHGD